MTFPGYDFSGIWTCGGDFCFLHDMLLIPHCQKGRSAIGTT